MRGWLSLWRPWHFAIIVVGSVLMVATMIALLHRGSLILLSLLVGLVFFWPTPLTKVPILRIGAPLRDKK